MTATLPLLFPAPRSVRVLDPTVRHRHELAIEVDPTLPSEGFEITVDDAGTVLRHADDAGFRYGRQTLEQLRAEDGSLPTVQIADHPDFAVRGFMLDVSRDRVPTRATLERLVTALAACRYNHLQLYVEHTFAYRGQESVWDGTSALDADDLRWLDERCRAVGIELAANQNGFGHLAPWLATSEHRHRAECPDGFEVVPGLTLPPALFEPTAENAAFVVELVREQAAALTSRIVNVGCDETFELGFGRSRERVEREGKAVVYAEHVRRIVEPLVADGRTVLYWGDVIAQHPEHLDLVPTEGTVALVWNYDAPDAPFVEVPDVVAAVLAKIGIDVNADGRFAGRLEPFAEAGLRHWVAPGTSTWNSLVGRFENARGNLLDAAVAGLGSGAEGYLVTDWGDGGHHQPLTVSLPPIAFGGAVAWGVEANRDLDVAAVLDRYVFGVGGLGALLVELGGLATRTGVVGRNTSPISSALFPGGLSLTSGTPDAEGVAGVLAALDDARDRLWCQPVEGTVTAELIEELAVAVALARFGAETLANRAEGEAGAGRRDPAERANELDALIARYRATWPTTSRPGGLDRSTAHLEATRDRLRAKATI